MINILPEVGRKLGAPGKQWSVRTDKWEDWFWEAPKGETLKWTEGQAFDKDNNAGFQELQTSIPDCLQIKQKVNQNDCPNYEIYSLGRVLAKQQLKRPHISLP